MFDNSSVNWCMLGMAFLCRTGHFCFYVSNECYNTRYYKNKLTFILKHEEKQFYQRQSIENKNNLQKVWTVTKKVINRNKDNRTSDQFNLNNRTETDQEMIAKGFNDYLANIGPNLASKINSDNVSYRKFLPPSISASLFWSNKWDRNQINHSLISWTRCVPRGTQICCCYSNITILCCLTTTAQFHYCLYFQRFWSVSWIIDCGNFSTSTTSLTNSSLDFEIRIQHLWILVFSWKI